MTKRKTTEEFKIELRKRYNTLEVVGEYINSKACIRIKCTKCGYTWDTNAGKLLDLSRTTKCKKCDRHTRNPEEFKSILKSKFPNIDLIDTYVDSTTRLKVRCTECANTWEINPNSIITKNSGSICRNCTPLEPPNSKRTTKQFQEELYDAKYNLTVIGEYTGSNNKIKVSCDKGHTWEVYPNTLLNKNIGGTCPECLKNTKHEEYSTALYTKYGILDFIIISQFTGIKDRIVLKCSKEHTWDTLAGNALYYGSGLKCPECNPLSTSKAEIELQEFISSIYSGWIEYRDRKLLPNNLEVDIVIPDKGLAFEYNGVYWHQEKFTGKDKHRFKTDYLMNEYGYQLIHINEDEWLQKQDIVKSRIRNLFGLSTKIHARKCKVREIDYPDSFLEENHIQGRGAPTSINLGLFYYDELVSVMTFSKPKFSKDYDYELVRFCSLLDISVVGGASKLYKYFTTHYKGSIVSYSDRRWSTGNLYKQLGFIYSHTSEPNYKYYRNAISLTRYQCQKHLLKDKFPNSYREDLTEKEIMQLEGFYPVYDCGNDVWTQKSPL